MILRRHSRHVLGLSCIKGYLKEQRYYNKVTHDQLHSSDTLGIDGLSELGMQGVKPCFLLICQHVSHPLTHPSLGLQWGHRRSRHPPRLLLLGI